MILFDWLDGRTVLIWLHVMGTVLGAGAAFSGDIVFITAARNKRLSARDLSLMQAVSFVVWGGLGLAIVSGIGLVWLQPDIFLYSEKLWAKLTVIGVLTVNGLAFIRYHRHIFGYSVDQVFQAETPVVHRRRIILLSGAVSATSWPFVIALGVLGRTPLSYVQFLGIYAILLVLAGSLALVLRNRILSASP